jgi:hypothetical protein
VRRAVSAVAGAPGGVRRAAWPQRTRRASVGRRSAPAARALRSERRIRRQTAPFCCTHAAGRLSPRGGGGGARVWRAAQHRRFGPDALRPGRAAEAAEEGVRGRQRDVRGPPRRRRGAAAACAARAPRGRPSARAAGRPRGRASRRAMRSSLPSAEDRSHTNALSKI